MNKKKILALIGLTATLATAATFLLFQLMPAGALAASESAQEIGLPKPVESKVNSCFDVHLSPGSDRFYTLRDGILAQYQIHPFKKLVATRGDWGVVKKTGCHMLVTDDEKKLLVISNGWIYAFNIVTGRLLNKAKWEYSSDPSPFVIINGDELLILERKMFGGHQDFDSRVWAELDIWDINTLKLKRKFTEFGKDFGFIQDTGVQSAMSKVQDIIYLRSGRSVVVLNSKTYKPELSLRLATFLHLEWPAMYDPKQLSVTELPLLSKDSRFLYVPRVSKVKDYLTGKQSSFDDSGLDKAFVFDQKTREYRIVSLENLSRDEVEPVLFSVFASEHLSRNKNYLMVRYGSEDTHAMLRTRSNGSFIFFFQYDGGEAIMFEHAADRRLLGFQLTAGARKYLMMDKAAWISINDACGPSATAECFTKYLKMMDKAKAARIPINDATFNKYHRP